MVPDTLPPTSRRAAHFGSSIHTFGDLSAFLRSAVADEEAREFSESMRELAARADEVVRVLEATRNRSATAPVLMDMLTVLREHRAQVLGLGLAWRGLYEYAGYLQSLNNFRILIGEWLMERARWDDEIGTTAEDFQLVAWRTLGDGMLLLEMYEQWVEGDGEPEVREPQRERVRQWWQKLRR